MTGSLLPDAQDAAFPDVEYLVLSSRLIPDLDGGYTIATLARARQMAAAGVAGGAGPQLLTFDPASADQHAQHRRVFAERDAVADPGRMRNLFDEAADPAGGAAPWLRNAASERPPARPPSERPAAESSGAPDDYRLLVDAEGRPFAALPVIAGDPDWHLTTAPVRVYGPEGDVVGALRGFRALYRAWLEHVVAALRDRPIVVICESRQLGELIAGWDDPRVRIIHTVHTIHLEPPFTADAALNPLWTRWFELVERFDAVLWPTPSQRDDVVARFGDPARHHVVPNVVPAGRERSAEREPGLVVVLGRLAPGKRIDQSIRAFAAAGVPGARMEIWGGGAEQQKLQTLIDELDLQDRVTLAGFTDDPGRVLDRASLLVTSTAFEGQPLTIVEALAHECPVVSYDVRYGIRDVLGQGGGILVPDGDEDALAEALRRALTDGDLHARLMSETSAARAPWAPARSMAALARVVDSVVRAAQSR